MKKARNGFIKNLRYLCLVGVIALGLMTIVGSNGDGGDTTTTADTTTTDDTATDDITGGPYAISGYIQKGPFISGSSITIQELDHDLDPTGESYQTTTGDDFGAFSLGSHINSKYTEVIATGFYFDEVAGELSAANLTLRATSDLSIDEDININILTTLEQDRIEYLIANQGLAFTEARTQAETEVLSIFNISGDNISTFDQMDISEEGDSNAILLAVSSILQGSNTVAELSELISKINLDIKEDGTLDDSTYVDEIKNNSMNLDLGAVRMNLSNRYESLGLTVTIPDFEDYVDSDGDGIINVDDEDLVEDVPLNVRATAGDEEITISWNSVSGATSYNIYWTTSTGVSKAVYDGKIGDITETSYTHTGLTNGTTYYYVVTGENIYRESGESIEVSAMPFGPFSYEWTMTIGDSEDDSGRSITLDSNNNIYVTGYFNGTVDFDPSDGIDNKNEITGPNGDYFITKINSDGSYGWTNIIESNDRYGGNKSIASDSNNNVYLTGNNTSSDMIVIKYNSGGNTQWTKIMDGDGYTVKGNAIDLDSNDNIYITGTFYSTVDFDPDAGVDNRTSNGESDIFITNLNSDGSYGWTKTIGGSSYDSGRSIAIDTNNNIYITGMFWGTVDFDPDGGVDNKTSNGIDDIFITKINNDESYGWTKVLTSVGSDDDVKFIITDQNNNLYVTGAFYSETDFDPSDGIDSRTPNGSGDIFITKINSDGSYSWTNTIGGTGSDMGHSITVDSNNNIYLIGTFSDTVDFDPSDQNDNKTSKGDWDIFITKYSSDGSYGGTATMGSISGEGDTGNSITIDPNSNLFITGRFFLNVDFNPGYEIDNKISNGDCDIFITKFIIGN